MLSFFGQYTYEYNVETTDTGGLLAVGGTLFVVYLVILVLAIVAMWKLFVKAGEPGWKALIPIYNYWTLCEIVGRPGWWSLLFLPAMLLFFIPLINFLAWLVLVAVSVVVMLDLGRAFKKTTTFSVVGLILFSLVGLLILGFGKDKYHGPDPVKLGSLDPKYTLKDGGAKTSSSKSSKES